MVAKTPSDFGGLPPREDLSFSLKIDGFKFELGATIRIQSSGDVENSHEFEIVGHEKNPIGELLHIVRPSKSEYERGQERRSGWIFGMALREERESKGMTREDLAEAIGKRGFPPPKVPAIRDLENGVSAMPKPHNLAKYIAALPALRRFMNRFQVSR